MSQHVLADLKAFLDNSPTSWHAAVQMGNRLATQDYIPLSEDEPWKLEKGKSYFITRGGAFCAFKLPKSKPKKATIFASHSDSPSLKIKPKPETQRENMTLFGVEVYGGPLLSSWLNRDLAIAGRVMILDKQGNTKEKLVFLDDAPVVIPQLAIHLDREVNEKGLLLNKQDHLSPLIGLSDKPISLETLLRRSLSFHKLLGFDLLLVPMEPSRFIGSTREMLSSYRIDNLISAHASLTALGMNKKPDKHTLSLLMCYDHEEIGSKTREGASSTFFCDVLKRIALFYEMDEEELLVMKNQSICLSMDMAHALNPNYPQKMDPNHQPLLGKGVVIKYNADHKYATNALSSSKVMQLAEELHLSLQSYVCRSDMPCGSTVGPLFEQQTGISTVDLGCPQLSMHSSREVMACQDFLDLCLLLAHVLKEE